MNLIDLFPDTDQALDRLVNSAYATGAQTALMESHKLLALRGMPDAADALLVHWDSILMRTNATMTATLAIDKARKE